MANKIIFIGLIVALLHVASAEEANPEPYMNDVSRMSAEIKATEERCTQKVSNLERKLDDLINLQTNSSEVATRPKRPAELACEKMNDLRSAGIHNNTQPYIIFIFHDDRDKMIYDGVLIEKRFVLITVLSSYIKQLKVLEFLFSDKVVSKKIKKVHTVAENWPHSIILVELDSDVHYNFWLYPTCLYTSELNPKSALMHDGKTLKIAEDSNCFDSDSKKLHPFEICVNDSCNDSELVFLVEEERKPQLFGFVTTDCIQKYQTLHKVSPYLDLIENIVWPKNGK
ncbi:uncharacterized protein LOC105228612 isoform X2 [Bactrocera dorsalis]|uniref:Uncharacterized protein LOC105228612 isoform X2 n=1 Tax=Bactrocera dorsalis TaxID=27457 RepID=A0ABM3JTZ6_BACDO|nr:uncharacterized protein LOC105228612 isoform X2 [Bactrocera dorsalis]XP_049312653.1 uncharacterized protein LOC105228612 isoform X2 [Bactrocera dorsalis]XP_049312654.1 uncharacterized protein LOC105228612 isoform X2 [Bactrocera dorsalis]XP_049312656.1 uncharacterized protein LOC105228612 isoform X2 [Bactrocera dorsalis]XP_049312657.1 uncharacterized protein LOC105228612 isoform X2 [Bactrocera dorsalis]XP_049312658.1 uncharacterized protein LOC105228612 isoform X2 [Bactrocera dorsalis]XP_04